MRPICTVLLMSITLCQPLFGQDIFEISSAEIKLMGLEFSAVTTVDANLGVRLPGRVIATPDNNTAVTSRFSGVLEKWLKRSGDAVLVGETIATLKSMDLIAAQQDYLEHWGEAQLAEQQAKRDEMLWQQGIIAEIRYQQSTQRLKIAQARLQASASFLTLAGLHEQELTALRSGEAELGLAFLRSDVNGILAQRIFAVGDSINADASIARLTQSGNAWVAISVPARLLDLFGPATTLSSPDGEWGFALKSRDYVLNPVSQSAEILAQFTNETPFLPGQLVNVAIHPSPSALMVPSQAVVHEAGQTLVYLYAAGSIEMRALQLVPVGDGYLTERGISLGEQLVTKGAALVKGMQLGLGQ